MTQPGIATHSSAPTILLRAEQRASERRTPITPDGAAELRQAGVRVLVESSAMRIFGDELYAAAGVELVPAGTWLEADPDVVVVGIKELPDEPDALRHRHVYFGHAFKGQHGAAELLGRFRAGGGQLLDLEYLVNDNGHRVVAFGYWAGFMGAALAALHLAGRLMAPLQPMSLDEVTSLLQEAAESVGDRRAVVTGAFGRAGRGAVDALRLADTEVSLWDRDDTIRLDSDALVAHDLLVHCVHATTVQPPFLTEADRLRPGRRLRVLSDVTADVTSALNLLPVSDRHTSWARPVRRIWEPATQGAVALDAIVIDNLPSLLPEQASLDFSKGLVPLLPGLFGDQPVWQRAADRFERVTSAHD